MKKLSYLILLFDLGLTSWTGQAQEAVDLGLSVKWASCNVGASSPSDYGDYYAWGEVQVKESYSWRNYSKSNTPNVSDSDAIYGRVDPADLTEYNGSDGKTRLDYSDDVARQKWGKKWRIPTAEEWYELKENCTWTWTEISSGRGGFVVTSNKNGNSIFLPAAGMWMGDFLSGEGSVVGFYWTSSLDTDNPIYAMEFSFFPGGALGWHVNVPGYIDTGEESRCYGHSIRPVTE